MKKKEEFKEMKRKCMADEVKVVKFVDGKIVETKTKVNPEDKKRWLGC